MSATPLTAKLIIGGFLLSVPVLLVMAALPRFTQGLRIETANTTLEFVTMGQRLPVSSYAEAAADYAQSPEADGADLTEYAEFSALSAGDDPVKLARVRPIAINALAHDPLNARVWTILCAIDAKEKPGAAVPCLGQAFALVGYDWFTAPQRMSTVAEEWPYLDVSLRNKAVSFIEPMWNTADWSNALSLRGALYELSATENGRELLRAGLEPSSLRDFNRFVIEERMNGD